MSPAYPPGGVRRRVFVEGLRNQLTKGTGIREAKDIRLGYASTVHKGQGRTVEHCHVLMGGHMTDLHLGYVQASRCRESTHLFIDRSHAGPDLSEAIQALSCDRPKDLASDLLDRCQRRAHEPEEALQPQRRHRL